MSDRRTATGSVEPAAAVDPCADPAPQSTPAAVDSLVTAALAVTHACHAVLWSLTAGGPTVLQAWHECGCDPEGVEWPRLVPDAHHWSAAAWWKAESPHGQAAIVVPVRADGHTLGLLGLVGSDLHDLDGSSLPMAQLLARLVATQWWEGPEDGPAHPLAHAPSADFLDGSAAMVDVFAFTVEVEADQALAWRYFGPNSHVILGEDLSPEEPLDALLASQVLPQDRTHVAHLHRSLLAGVPVETEFRLVGRDGVVRWVSWRAVPRRDADRVLVDVVATDVSARRTLADLHQQLLETQLRHVEQVDTLREHATLVREANDAVLQRLFAAGLRLQMLRRRLQDTEAHAAAAISFQLDEAANDLRGIIHGLNALIDDVLVAGQPISVDSP